MGNQNTIELRLTVKDDGTVVVQQFGKNAEQSLQKTDKATKSATNTLATYKSMWLEITATAATAGFAFYKALEYMELGAKSLQAEDSFGMMTRSVKTDGAAMLAAIQQASARTIDESKSMQKAVFAVDQDIDPNKLPQLFEAARIAARKTGIDVEQAADRIIDSVATQMPRGLKSMGMITKEQMEIFTRAFAAGRTDVDLLNFVIANAAVTTARMGGVTENATERVQQLKAALWELKESAGKELVENLDSVYLMLKKYEDTKAGKIIEGIAKGFFGSPLRKTKTLGPDQTDDLTGFWIEQNVEIAEANRKALELKEKGKISAIRIAEDEAKNIKSINELGLKDSDNLTKARLESMKLSYASELSMAIYTSSRKLEEDKKWYSSRLVEIAMEGNALQAKDKYFDKSKWVADQLAMLDIEAWNRTKAYSREQDLLYIRISDTRRAAAAAAGYAEQKQIADLVEFRRTQGGKRIAVDVATWEQIQNYERLTGEKIKVDQVRFINEEIQLYKRDLVGGVRWSLMEIEDEYSNTGQLMGDFTKRTFSSMADTLAENTMKMRWDFTDLANSVCKDLLRIYYQQQILGPLSGAASSWLGSLFSTDSGSTSTQSQTVANSSASSGVFSSGLIFERRGDIFSKGNIIPFGRGGVVPRPTIFPMANGNIGLMGEAGAEAVMPLTRLPGGDLGVKAANDSPSTALKSVTVNIVNQGGQEVKSNKSQASFNMQELIVTVWLDAHERNAYGLRDRLSQ